MCRVFKETLAHNLRPNAIEQDIKAEDLTPVYETCEDVHELNPDHGDLEVTPEIGDYYLSAEIMILQGGTVTKGRVKSQKKDANGNPIGLANSNPILDTCKYIVEFTVGDETTVNANLIAEAMYAHCDPDGNQYDLLDSLINHRHLAKAI